MGSGLTFSLVEQEKFDSLSQMETFISGKGINVSSITLTSTESVGSPALDGTSWDPGDLWDYVDDNTISYNQRNP